MGRTDLVLVTVGENVDPEEVERALRSLAHVQSACVFGVPCAQFGQRISAVVVLEATSGAQDPVRWSAAMRAGLAVIARSKIPRSFSFVVALPMTATGKLDRASCVRQFSGAVGVPPSSSQLSVAPLSVP